MEHFSKRTIPFEIGLVRDTETNFSNGLFALFSWFFKIWTQSPHRMWKTKLQTLCLIFDSRFGKFFLKMQNLSIASQNIHLLFSPIICIFPKAVINIVSMVWSSSFLGVLWKASIPFEIRYVWGTWKQIKAWKYYIFLQIMAYTDFERSVNRRIFTGIFYSWSALKWIRPMFWIKIRGN